VPSPACEHAEGTSRGAEQAVDLSSRMLTKSIDDVLFSRRMHIRMMPKLIERKAAGSGLVVHEASVCFWVAQKSLLVAKKAALCPEIAIASLSARDPTESVNRERLPE
jgi:hypothetical protein